MIRINSFFELLRNSAISIRSLHVMMGLTVAFITLSASEVASPDRINDKDSLIYVTETVSVMDTLQTEEAVEKELSLLRSKEKEVAHIIDSLNKKQNICTSRREQLLINKNAYRNKGESVNDILSMVTAYRFGGKIKDVQHKKTLEEVFNNINLGNGVNGISDDSIITVIYINPDRVEDAFAKLNQKKQSLEDVRKKIKKGKLTEAALVYITEWNYEYNRLISCRISQVDDQIWTVEDEIRRLKNVSDQMNNRSKQLSDKILLVAETGDLAKKYKVLTGNTQFPSKSVDVLVAKENEYYRPIGKYDARLDHKIQIMGWEWAEGRLATKRIYYPLDLSYEYNEQYPDLRIRNNCVYDSVGSLIRVLSYNGNDIYSKFKNSYEEEVIKEDYKNNKYGILNKGKDVKYALENSLGLSKEHNTKINQIDKRVVGTFQNTKGKPKKANKIAAQNLMGLMFDSYLEKSRLENEEAENFIRQCKEDHKDEFGTLWKIDRISDTSFQIYIYCDKQMKIRSWKVEFTADEPFGNVNPTYQRQPDSDVPDDIPICRPSKNQRGS